MFRTLKDVENYVLAREIEFAIKHIKELKVDSPDGILSRVESKLALLQQKLWYIQEQQAIVEEHRREEELFYKKN